MTDTVTSTRPRQLTEAHHPLGGSAALIAGLTIVVLGTAATISTDIVGAAWFIAAGCAALLFSAALSALRRAISQPRTARIALTVATAAMVLFGLSHFYAVVDEDTAVILFSVFMVVTALSLIVAGAAALRAHTGTPAQRALLLTTGIWPLATVPAGAAIGDIPHFLAVTIWGACWAAAGAALLVRNR